MGEASDRKVTEIDETRRRLEGDLRELEARMPGPLRGVKSVVGVIVGGTALTGLALKRFGSKRSGRRRPTEVVVRIVRDDE